MSKTAVFAVPPSPGPELDAEPATRGRLFELHGAREPLLPAFLLEIRVEQHRHVAHEELSEREHAQHLAVEGDEAIRRQLVDAARERRLDVPAGSRAELRRDLT